MRTEQIADLRKLLEASEEPSTIHGVYLSEADYALWRALKNRGQLSYLLDCAEAVLAANFRVAPNVPHPFLGAAGPAGTQHLWCRECERDSGLHWRHCSKVKSLLEELEQTGAAAYDARDLIRSAAPLTWASGMYQEGSSSSDRVQQDAYEWEKRSDGVLTALDAALGSNHYGREAKTEEAQGEEAEG